MIKKIYNRGRYELSQIADIFRKKNVYETDPSQMWGRVFDLTLKQRVELDGFNLFALPNDYIGASIIASKSYEFHVTDVIREELHEGEVFLDLGANLGYFSMLACSIVKAKGKVIAFEPNPQNLQLIYESQLDNKFTNLKVYPFAVSDQSTILRFTTVGSNGGVITEHSKDQEHYLLVQSVVIDEILANEQNIDLIKMDIEAHELIALRGMEKLLMRLRPKIITEFHPWAMRLNNLEPPEEFLDKIQSLGYRLSVIKHEGGIEKMNSTAEVIDFWEKLNSETIHLDLYATPE